MKRQELFAGARWMTPDADTLTPLCRQRFTAAAAQKATLTICGLGFFAAWLNGQPVTQDLFVPLNTNFFPRPIQVKGRPFEEEMACRLLCCRYDVTALLAEGPNLLGVRLAPGYYNYDHTTPYGPARLIFRLEIENADGSCSEVLSGDGLRWHPSEVTEAAFTRGETQDLSLLQPDWLEIDAGDSGWRPMVPSPTPDTDHQLMQSPADRHIRTLLPTVIARFEGKTVYDIGENITGRPVLACPAGAPAAVTLRAAEERTPDGRLDEHSFQDLCGQHFVVHTDGAAHTVTLQTTWLAGRYFEVEGPAVLTAFEVIHADVPVTARFDCADPVLNWLFDTYLRTQLANMHGGIPSDCPHIERRGYTGDGQLAGEAAMQLLDGEAFYRKWIDDIADCQDRRTGHVQYTAPYVPSGGGPGGWGCAIVEVPYTFYKIYGDPGPMQRLYPQMLHWFDYLDAHSEDGLVTSDQPGCWCLGDWCTAEKIAIPQPYVNNYFYIKSLRRVLTFCPQQDRAALQARERRCTDAVLRHYWDAATGSFCGGIQGADAFAVDLGLGDERTLQNLAAKYRALGGYDTGIFGTDILTRVLFRRGYPELALQLMASRSRWGYAQWMRQGATTLWEYWTGERSHSHPMFGAAVRYLHQDVLGIRQPQDGYGFDRVTVAPARLPQLAFARGAQATPHGEIAVDWARLDERIHITVTLPVGIQAELAWGGQTYPLQPGTQRFDLPFEVRP